MTLGVTKSAISISAIRSILTLHGSTVGKSPCPEQMPGGTPVGLGYAVDEMKDS